MWGNLSENLIFQVPQMNMSTEIINLYNIFHIVFVSLYPTIPFWRDRNRDAATLLFCVITAIARYTEYIETRVENFHLYSLIM